MVILVLNCGSSSIKYQVIDMEDASSKLLAKGIVERIGLPEGDLTHKPVGKEPFELHQPIPDHTTGIKLVLDALTDPAHGVIASLDEVKAVGHRVAHGGEFFPESCIVTEDTKEKIRSLFEIAPLHNPANLEGVLSIEKVLPGVKQDTVFDTSFHQSIPAVNYMYALPHAYYEKYRVRKYGFHGTSHRYVSERYSELTGKSLEGLKLITCHLGNGASITAIKDGKVIDTSMGLTPLDGFMMSTRSGTLDPSVVTFMAEKEHISPKDMSNLLNKKSGVLGISGKYSDDRDLPKACAEGDERAILARDMQFYQIRKCIGSYIAALDGIDAIVFTGGIGENAPHLRENILTHLNYYGVKIDVPFNKTVWHGMEEQISTPDSKVDVWVIPTNEELVIARDTKKIVDELKSKERK